METLFTTGQGWMLLAGYALIAVAVTVLFTRFARSKVSFLAADRRVGWRPAAFSIAATWIWAPALFAAAEKAYLQGWVGVFWFTVPNILCLVAFAWFADRVRRRMPEGFTLAHYVRTRTSRRVHGAYLTSFSGLAACSFAVQLLAGGLIISNLTGIGFTAVTVTLAAIAIGYSLFSGLGASVTTDYLQMAFIALVGLVAAPWIVSQAGGLSTVAAGLGGVTGEHTSLISGAGVNVFLTFGLATTIGLMSGPFGDQSFWQRAFAVRRGEVRRAFYVGAVIFGIVPVTMSLLGFAAAGAQLDVAAKVGTTQLTNLAAVLEWLPTWTVVPFVFFILSGLVSTLDSNLCAISSLAGHDLHERRAERGLTVSDDAHIRTARWSMVLLGVVATAIANVPGLTIVSLFVFYGLLRASTLLPTILMLAWRRDVDEAGVFWGIVTALVVALPIFAYGNFAKVWQAQVGGALLVLAFSGGIAYLRSQRVSTRLLSRSEYDGTPEPAGMA